MGTVILPTDLSQASIEKILQDFYKDPSLKVVHVSGQETFLGANENFCSTIKSWTVTVQQEGSPERQVSFVVKSSSTAPFQKKFSTVGRPFAKELFWFKRAHPTLTKLCPELKNISPITFYANSNYEGRMFRFNSSFINRSPLVVLKLLLAKKYECGILLLENLKFGEKPMKMHDKSKIMTVDQVRVVFQTLARFHGSWLKWRHMSAGEKETEDGIRTRDIEGLTVEMSPMMMKLMLKDTMKPFPKLLRNFNKDEDLIRRLEAYSRDSMIKRNLEISSTKKEMEKSRIVTLCHGDAWSNNMMFSEDESEVVLLDFQLMGLAHPARDLWYFLSVSSDADFRRAHLHDLLKDYFDVFVRYLKDADIEMTFEEFEREVLDRRDILLSVSTSIMPTALSAEVLELTDWASYQEIVRKREVDLVAEPKPDDHPNLKEIRRRLITMIEEAAECNFI